MIIISIYLCLYIFILIFDLIPIIKNNYKKLFWFNIITLSISFLIIILVGLQVKVINPTKVIENIIKKFIG